MRRKAWTVVKNLSGGLVIAVIVYLILAAPGLLSDRDSTVPLHASQEAGR